MLIKNNVANDCIYLVNSVYEKKRLLVGIYHTLSICSVIFSTLMNSTEDFAFALRWS